MILIMQILELTSQVYEYFPRLWVNTFINLFLVQNYKLGTNHFFQSSEAHALETKICILVAAAQKIVKAKIIDARRPQTQLVKDLKNIPWLRLCFLWCCVVCLIMENHAKLF